MIFMASYEKNVAQLKTYKEQQAQENRELKERMGKIKHKIAVISGKGGVGKSTVTVNLATAFAHRKTRGIQTQIFMDQVYQSYWA